LLTHKGGVGFSGKGFDIGSMKVPDARLEELAKIFNPLEISNVEIEFADTTGAIGKGETSAELQKSDALVCCIRAFDAGFGKPEQLRDLSDLFDDMVLFDLGVLERRLENIDRSLRAPKPEERGHLEKERALVCELKEKLDSGTMIRELELSKELSALVTNFGLLTSKAAIVVFNCDEERYKIREESIEGVKSKYKHIDAFALMVGLELEMEELSNEDAKAFKQELGIEDDSITRFIERAYRAMNTITFFTCNNKEVRAWTIHSGSSAIEAAGKVHSDLARGFIRAEVIRCERLFEFGDWNKARSAGAIHTEGKEYIVQEGDVILVKFAV